MLIFSTGSYSVNSCTASRQMLPNRSTQSAVLPSGKTRHRISSYVTPASNGIGYGTPNGSSGIWDTPGGTTP